jgi:hypothetical protein
MTPTNTIALFVTTADQPPQRPAMTTDNTIVAFSFPAVASKKVTAAFDGVIHPL